MTPRITVLLAVYNGGAYLAEAVDSVLAQTYGDFELLLVDDASTDGALEALPHDPRIRVLRNEQNIGQIPSLNRGLRDAQGEYVARLDADDVCLPQRLERQVALFDAHPDIDLIATWTDVVDDTGRLWAPVRSRVDSFADFVSQIVTGRVSLVHPSIAFRRDVVLELGGFDETLNASEDQDLYRRLVLARHEARVIPETLLRYRRHDQQMTIAKSDAVWESDERSYDAFVAALSSDSPATTLRMLFRDDARFWRQRPVGHAELERFLADLAAKLRLDPGERTAVAAAIADSAAAALVSGWGGAASPSAYSERARGLAAFAGRHGEGRTRRIGSVAPALVATAFAGRGIGAVRVSLRAALRSDTLAGLRQIARGSRVLRRIYTRVVDARARRD